MSPGTEALLPRHRDVDVPRVQPTQGLITNSEMGPVEAWDYCRTDETGQGLLQAAMKQMDLSACGYHRLPKVARTIADLAESDDISRGTPGRSPAVPPIGLATARIGRIA